MSENYIARRLPAVQRRSTISSMVFRPQDVSINDTSPVTSVITVPRPLSNIPQPYLPHEDEYFPQERVPPTGPEAQQPFVGIVEDDENSGEENGISILDPTYHPTIEDTLDQDRGTKLDEKTRRILFFSEPIIGGLLLFPIIVLFWESGWNINLIFLNLLNNRSLDYYVKENVVNDIPVYKWQSLIYPYLIVQILLLIYYLGQDLIYNFLKKQRWLIKTSLLKLHIFLLATIYIIQWVMLWTMWEEFISHEWYFELTLSLTGLFAFIVFNGHLSDLVCSPFLFGYDSIEYCIYFGCPLLTREMKQWKINLINYVIYEIIMSNLSVITWRGFYNFVDNYFLPNDEDTSAGISLLIGYILYCPLMYFQTYLEELNMKYEFWTFVSINFPQFYRNIRHLFAFISCIFSWRGFWVFYDSHIHIFKDYYKTCLVVYMGSFLVLAIFQTSSSINGPLSHINEKNNFFPLYPHCYISIIQRKFSRFFFTKPQTLRMKLNNN